MHRSLAVISLTILLLMTIWAPLPLFAQETEETPQPQPELPSSWSEPVNVSNTPKSSWFPDMVVDKLGRIHLIWCESTALDTGGDKEQVLYTVGDGQTWRTPNDLVPPSPFIERNALAIDNFGVLHLVYRYPLSSGYGAHHMTASADEAWSAAVWSSPRLVSSRGSSYASDLVIDSQGTLHLIYDDRGEDSSECRTCADIFYRHSKDSGRTWSAPQNLSKLPWGSSRGQIKADTNDMLHVTWDEGWDRLTGRGLPDSSFYTYSTDGGNSWAEPMRVSSPVTGTVQLASGADGKGGVMLVWRSAYSQEIFYQWSTNNGASWAKTQVLPGVTARIWENPFDAYDIAKDSAGHLHLLVVGQINPDPREPLGVYHIEWDGAAWSAPQELYRGEGYPEYPRIVVSEGNRLHAAWFVRDDLTLRLNYEIWYSTTQSSAPFQPPAPTNTPSPTSIPTPIPTSAPNATPLYNGRLPDTGPSMTVPTHDIYTDMDDVLLLAVAVSPLALIVILIYVIRRSRLHR